MPVLAGGQAVSLAFFSLCMLDSWDPMGWREVPVETGLALGL